jgi:hypothetical protein
MNDCRYRFIDNSITIASKQTPRNFTSNNGGKYNFSLPQEQSIWGEPATIAAGE